MFTIFLFMVLFHCLIVWSVCLVPSSAWSISYSCVMV